MNIFLIVSRQFEMDAIFVSTYLQGSNSRGTFHDYRIDVHVYGIVSTKRDQAHVFSRFQFL